MAVLCLLEDYLDDPEWLEVAITWKAVGRVLLGSDKAGVIKDKIVLAERFVCLLDFMMLGLRDGYWEIFVDLLAQGTLNNIYNVFNFCF